jgi:DNA-binding NarL/FixJ family response regulator
MAPVGTARRAKDATVVIADDHPSARAGIADSLAGRGFTVVASVGDAAAAVEATLRHQPDVALLDVFMPGGGIAAAARIHEELPDVAIVMLTVAADDDHLFAALRAGASGYLLKDTDPERLPAALTGVLAGEAALPRALVARVINEFQGRAKRRVPLLGKRPGVVLTAREWEVLELLKNGKSTSQVATMLGMAPVTVRTHVAAILRKLQVPDRASAFALLDDDEAPPLR